MKKLTSNGFTALASVLIIAVAALLGGAGYYTYQNEASKDDQTSTASDKNIVKSETPKSTARTNKFEDKEHGFSFEYPEDLKVQSERIWIDKPQGGLTILVYKPGDKNTGSPEELESLLIEDAVAKVEVINTEIDDVEDIDEVAKSSDKTTRTICGQTATTFTIDPKGLKLYITAFKKDNLLFTISSDLSNLSRKTVHDNIVDSLACYPKILSKGL